MIELFDYQKPLANKALQILLECNLVYIAAEERTGKTPMSLWIAEKLGYSKVLILTKKKALSGWEEWRAKTRLDLRIYNYEKREIPNDSYQIAILDEAHYALSSYPKPSQTARKVQSLVYDLPIVFLSATPSAQSFSLLFHQLNMSKFSPWSDFRNFYDWHRQFGIPRLIRAAGGRQVNSYDETKEDLIKKSIEPYFLFLTRRDASFKVEPNDKLLFVDLQPETIQRLKNLEKGVLELPDRTLYNVSTLSRELRLSQMLESGVGSISDLGAGIERPFIDFGEYEKIDYILENFGDRESLVIFYEYKCEGVLLNRIFKKAKILQGTSYAEGVDLSHLDTSIVFSQNFSSSKYIQRRARLCSFKREKEIDVYYIITKRFDKIPTISQLVYDCVATKRRNFTESLYRCMKGETNE